VSPIDDIFREFPQVLLGIRGEGGVVDGEQQSVAADFAHRVEQRAGVKWPLVVRMKLLLRLDSGVGVEQAGQHQADCVRGGFVSEPLCLGAQLGAEALPWVQANGARQPSYRVLL
jgi:hypothetical protein